MGQPGSHTRTSIFVKNTHQPQDEPGRDSRMTGGRPQPAANHALSRFSKRKLQIFLSQDIANLVGSVGHQTPIVHVVQRFSRLEATCGTCGHLRLYASTPMLDASSASCGKSSVRHLGAACCCLCPTQSLRRSGPVLRVFAAFPRLRQAPSKLLHLLEFVRSKGHKA